MYVILSVGTVFQVHIYTSTYILVHIYTHIHMCVYIYMCQIVHFKCVWFIVCQFHLHKSFKNNIIYMCIYKSQLYNNMQYIENEWNTTYHTKKLSGAGMETRKQKKIYL